MREIKFRAWDEKYGEWLDPAEHVIYADDGSVAEVCDLELVEFVVKNVKLEQFTGLHDKNGKEVYEGDIVTCSEGCPHKIIWVEGLGGTFFGGMPAWYLSGLNEGYSWTEDEEVIGNVHENPELIESKKEK